MDEEGTDGRRAEKKPKRVADRHQRGATRFANKARKKRKEHIQILKTANRDLDMEEQCLSA